LDRAIEFNGVLETAKELGVTIISYTPLESGLLTGKYHKNPELLAKKSPFYRSLIKRGIDKSRKLIAALETVGEKYNATPAQVALNWIIYSQGDSVVTIPGVTNPKQAEDNAGAMRFRLSGDELARLDKVTRAVR
jgi:aryl-alcohol dehydrogenase-like predicted oxidoreductase